MKLLESKVAIVTGAGSGIGQHIALRFAEEGCKVVVSDISEEAGRGTVERIRSLQGEAEFLAADSSKPGDNERLVELAKSKYGGLHIAVNNAGIGGPQAPVGEYPLDGWEKVIGVNLSGVFYGMRYQIPAMLESGGGSIINIASILGQVGFRNAGAYCAAKHGVVGLTQTAALEYGPQRIRVNAVAPGFIRTPLVEKGLPADAVKALEGMHALGRLGESNEVAEFVLWLASEKSSFVTGSYLPIDGGYLAQ